MNTKLLLLIGAVLGLLLLSTLSTGLERDQPDCTSQVIDSGHFVLEMSGQPILEEVYTIEFDVTEGYLLNSQGAILANGQTVMLAQQTQYDNNLMPINYQLAAETPSGAQIISAQMGLGGLEMEVRVGLNVQNASVTDVENLALLDNNLIGQFAVLLLAIRSETLDRHFTAAIPQALLSLPARVEGPNSVAFYSGGEEFQGKQFDLHLGDTVITLLEHDGHLIGLANRTQGTIGYDMDRLPGGLTLDAPAETSALPAGVSEAEVAFVSGDLTLKGTLALPLTPASELMPAALFIHGSGPVDRDGNAAGMQMDAYKQLAQALAEAGIASFRFDKRGVGSSEGDASLASRDDLIGDVRAALIALRAQPQIDSSKIILIGHSEGAYLAPILAAEDPTLAGLVLLAGAARPLDEITLWQVESLLIQQGMEGDVLEAALVQQGQYISFVEASTGEWSDYTAEDLQARIPWLTAETAAQIMASPLALSWQREHYLAEPAEILAQVQQPVLILSGEKDTQVPYSEAALIAELLQEAGNKDVTVTVLPDLNHLLRHHPEEPNLTYRHLDEPVDSRVIDTLQAWLVEHFGD